MPRVTLLIPSFNPYEILSRALSSALNQTRPADEVIVIDDSPGRDLSELIATEFPGVRYFPCKRNVGAAEARNIGIRAATGEVIATLDDDDRLLPAYLERQMASFETDPDVVLSATDCLHYPLHGGSHYSSGTKLPCFASALLHCVRQGMLLTMSQVAFRRDAVVAVGMLNPRFSIVHDHDLYLRLMKAGRLAHVPECLVEKHEQHGSISRNVPRMLEELEQMYEGFIADPSNASLIGSVRQFRADILAGFAGTCVLHARDFWTGQRYLYRAMAQHPIAAVKSIYRRTRAKVVRQIAS
ncbi:MAG: glycosyltransferase family 2 protein [Bdellovibrionota bacterium]